MISNHSQHQIVYTHPQSTFRGQYQSDTLWGLLCWGIRMVHGKKRLESYLDSCIKQSPEFIISSTFPFERQGDKTTCFFPTPILPPFQPPKGDSEECDDDDDIMDRKKLKKIKLLPHDFFVRMLKGEIYGPNLKNELLAIKTQNPAPERGKIHVTHNTVDRRMGGGTYKPPGKAGLLFHTEDSFVLPHNSSESKDKKAGLFFLLSYGEGVDTQFLTPVFKLFSHIGMGGDRSIGKGFFDFEVEARPSDLTQAQSKANAHLLLSLCHPQQVEARQLDQSNSPLLNYKLVVRQGKVGMIAYHRKLAKKPLLMFEEGSVFPTALKGKVEVVIPQQADIISFPVYQSGMAYTLPIYIPES